MFFQANKYTNLILLQAYLDYLWHKKHLHLHSESKMWKYFNKITLEKDERGKSLCIKIKVRIELKIKQNLPYNRSSFRAEGVLASW